LKIHDLSTEQIRHFKMASKSETDKLAVVDMNSCAEGVCKYTDTRPFVNFDKSIIESKRRYFNIPVHWRRSETMLIVDDHNLRIPLEELLDWTSYGKTRDDVLIDYTQVFKVLLGGPFAGNLSGIYTSPERGKKSTTDYETPLKKARQTKNFKMISKLQENIEKQRMLNSFCRATEVFWDNQIHILPYKTSGEQQGVDIAIALRINKIINYVKEYQDQDVTIVLVSGDGDFLEIVRNALNAGIRVEMWSWRKSFACTYDTLATHKLFSVGYIDVVIDRMTGGKLGEWMKKSMHHLKKSAVNKGPTKPITLGVKK
jgi:uncharacterized LabA/DUF88 family protein